MRRINCQSCKNLTELPDLPPNLRDLFCDDNQLTALPALPPSLYMLECNNNRLTSLPDLPHLLNSLFCNNNQLTVLPTLPPNLTELMCDNNQITVLPALPKSLRYVTCSGNNIIQIDCDLSSLNIYIELNTNNLNLDSLKKYKEYLIRLVKSRRLPQDKIEPILRNIDERMALKNFELSSGKNKEIVVGNEAIQRGNMDLIKSYITDRKGGRKTKKSRKTKRSRKAKKSRKTKKSRKAKKSRKNKK
jgi:Leucine-rich repeat (LRR) protein